MQRANLKRKRPSVDGTGDADGDETAPEPARLQRQILPVAHRLAADFEGVPRDGMEYLFTVRQEDAQLPVLTVAPSLPAPTRLAAAAWVQRAKTVKAKLESSAAPDALNDSATANVAGPSCVPSEEWRAAFVEGFRRFRQNIQQPTIYVGPTPTPRYPKVSDRANWFTFITGRGDPSTGGGRANFFSAATATPAQASTVSIVAETAKILSYTADELPTERTSPAPTAVPEPTPTEPDSGLEHGVPPPGTPPTTALLRSLDQKSLLHLLMYCAHWLDTRLHPPTPGPPAYPTSPFEPALSPLLAQWVFAFLGRLDDRLMGGEIHTLRMLARACRELLVRSWTLGEAVAREGEGESDAVGRAREEERNACWIVLAAVAGVWGQSDLWEDARDAVEATGRKG